MRSPSYNGSIYLVGSRLSNLVKIGFSTNVPKRLKTLQTGSPVPLEVWRAVPGNLSLERELQNHLREYRTWGEWFDFKGASCVGTVEDAMQIVRVAYETKPTAAELRERREADYQARIRALVDASDPLTPEQVRELRYIFAEG